MTFPYTVIGDKLINLIVGVYIIHNIRIPIKGGMAIPNIATFDHGTYSREELPLFQGNPGSWNILNWPKLSRHGQQRSTDASTLLCYPSPPSSCNSHLTKVAKRAFPKNAPPKNSSPNISVLRRFIRKWGPYNRYKWIIYIYIYTHTTANKCPNINGFHFFSPEIIGVIINPTFLTWWL